MMDDVFPFAFEFYYNYEEEGVVSTESSDALVGHYFAIPYETVLYGDGRYLAETGGYYKGTDAGYMRIVLYGGIFFFLSLVIYQSLYFMKPLSIAIRRTNPEDYADFICLLFLFIHLFILEYKSDTIGTQNIMEVLLLFLGSSYMIRYYYREDHEEDIAHT
jgi:hypothetical protein